MDEEFVSIIKYFKSFNISLKCDFLLAVGKFYIERKRAQKSIPLIDFVFYQFLHNDIKHTVIHKYLPPKYPENGKLLINQVFQINYAKLIDVPMHSGYTQLSETMGDLEWYNTQDDDNGEFYSSLHFTSNNFEENQVLLMELCDGNNVLKAIEKQPIVGLNTNVTPGTKIAIYGHVFFSNGILHINNTLATVLGGDFEELYKINIKSVVERKLHILENHKKKIKQIQDDKRKRTTLPKPPEASNELMKDWFSESKISPLEASNDFLTDWFNESKISPPESSNDFMKDWFNESKTSPPESSNELMKDWFSESKISPLEASNDFLTDRFNESKISPPESSNDFMKDWFNESKISTLNYLDDSKLLLDNSHCSNNDLNKTSFITYDEIDASILFEPRIIDIDDSPGLSSKTKKKDDFKKTSSITYKETDTSILYEPSIINRNYAMGLSTKTKEKVDFKKTLSTTYEDTDANILYGSSIINRNYAMGLSTKTKEKVDLKKTLSTTYEETDTNILYGSNIINRNYAMGLSTKTKEKVDFKKTLSTTYEERDTSISYEPSIINRDYATGFSTKSKEKIGHLFQPISKKFKTSKDSSMGISHNRSRNFQKITSYYSPMKKKYRLPFRKQSGENILRNQTFHNREMFTSKSKEFSLIDELRPKYCFDKKQTPTDKRVSNSYVIPRVPYDNQSSIFSPIIPSSDKLNKTYSKNERNILPNVQKFPYSKFSNRQGSYTGFKEDPFPNIIHFVPKDDDVKLNISNRKRSLDNYASNISSNYRSRHSSRHSSNVKSDRNMLFTTQNSHYKQSDNYKTKSSSHSNIGMPKIICCSSDSDIELPSTFYDKSVTPLAKTKLFRKKDKHFNTSNNSDVFIIPPSKISKLDNKHRKQSQLYNCGNNTISDADKKMNMSFDDETLDIKGKIVKITKNLTIKDNQWTMEVEINDGGEESLICPIHHKYISKFLGVSASTNLSRSVQKEVENRRHFFYKQLNKKNDLIFSIEMFSTHNDGVPVIKNIKTVKEAEVNAS